MRRLPPKYDPKPTQSEGETSAPLIADHRNFYKVEKWMKDGSKVDYMLYGLDPTLQCDYSGGQASKVASPSSMSAFSATARWALSSSAERLKLLRLEAVALA